MFSLSTAAAVGDTIAASDPRVQWAGRIRATGGAVSFDWPGVSARVAVTGASFVSVTATTDQPSHGTRLKGYVSDQGFELYPTVEAWVSPLASNSTLLWASGNGSHSERNLTVEALTGSGITTVASFHTDGSFAQQRPLHTDRRIEFVGDSITAATNNVRPDGAPACADHAGLQGDWSRTYAGLLCHRFGAACSTVAVGGKCMLRLPSPPFHACGGLQMPDYYLGAMRADAPAATFGFDPAQAPTAIFVNLGTNDLRVTKQGGAWPERFVNDTVDFMRNATRRWRRADIQFFLSAGPMENATAPLTQQAVARARALNLSATFVDLRGACAAVTGTAACDGCASHPGLRGHAAMAELAAPVIARVMGWDGTAP